jgi:pimeloyl-ACP methyl ester carboxylesterase
VRVVGIDGAGHWLHHDRLEEFLRIVREFLGSPAVHPLIAEA